MDEARRRRLALELHQAGRRAAAVLVHRFAESVRLSPSEVAGLLPGVLGQAEEAIRGLAVEALRTRS